MIEAEKHDEKKASGVEYRFGHVDADDYSVVSKGVEGVIATCDKAFVACVAETACLTEASTSTLACEIDVERVFAFVADFDFGVTILKEDYRRESRC